MITVSVRFKGDRFAGVSAEGHALAGVRGSDPVCAGVTVLLRTALRSFMALDSGAVMNFQAGRQGEFSFEIANVPDEMDARFSGVTLFFMQGLSDLAAENPEHVRLVTYSE